MGWLRAWAAEVITMWPEPLTPDTLIPTKHTALIRVRAGDGRTVARVRALYNAQAGYGILGAMAITDARGGPKQRVRALALLVSEALRAAGDLGIKRAHTDVDPERPALLDFARRLAGRTGDASHGAVRIGGLIHEMRTAAIAASDAGGNLTGPDIADL